MSSVTAYFARSRHLSKQRTVSALAAPDLRKLLRVIYVIENHRFVGCNKKIWENLDVGRVLLTWIAT
ncbi:hypothetical protein Y032_0057g2759 [Ancylostoma ceylanicum]|uniref:Uncharacterized protein n=1 Tax=Ancylostoma ceylanicum TaxID=53326 RepID=A0A016U5J2_9BILA|nr:hypothetical protein Y032_0057g2759 [Ancylostoma ceylanicum]